MWIPVFREIDLEPSPKRRTSKTRDLMSLGSTNSLLFSISKQSFPKLSKSGCKDPVRQSQIPLLERVRILLKSVVSLKFLPVSLRISKIYKVWK